MVKKKGKPVTEVHSAPRKLNPDAPRRVVTMLPVSVIVKCKTQATERGITLTKFLAQLIINNVKG
jgi:hypothetical protein